MSGTVYVTLICFSNLQWKPNVDPDYLAVVSGAMAGPIPYLLEFTGNKPNKPKPHRISTLITAAFGGWLTVRTAVLSAFGQCKDPEYVLLIFLLDELVPLMFYFYSVIFRGGDYHKWLEAMMRLALMFLIQRRRHYDKATLCQLSDYVHHKRLAIPSLNQIEEQ